MIIIRGNTFPHRDYIKSIGGRWNNIEKAWSLDYLSDTDRMLLRGYRLSIEGDKPARTKETIIVGDDPTYFNYFRNKNPIVFFGFSSIAKFAEYVEAIEPNDKTNAWSTHPKTIERAGTDSVQHACDIARYGWSDGLGLVPKLDVPRPRSKQRAHSAVGGAVSVGRMLAGNPAHMITRRARPGHKFIRLFVDTTSTKNVEPWHEIMRALIVGSMVDLLEDQGYRCEIIGIQNGLTIIQEPSDQLAIVVKEAGERLNLMDITFSLGHPSFGGRLRNAAISQYAHLTEFDKRFGGYVDLAFDDRDGLQDNEFYIPPINSTHVAQFTDDPLSMVQFIEPDGLPVSLRSDK